MTWISVADRLPPEGQEVWCFAKDESRYAYHQEMRSSCRKEGFQFAAYRVGVGNKIYWFAQCDFFEQYVHDGEVESIVTHWQPLPHPPGTIDSVAIGFSGDVLNSLTETCKEGV